MQSPCVARCGLNDDEICTGCFRHIDEIVGWGSASEGKQQQIWQNLTQRKAQYASEKHNRSEENSVAKENSQIISREKWLQAEKRLAEQDA
ncbi:DUF1289 domain-containing protein [Shewanella psychrotolerans]|uniref:DUF1289 domain-containing protein n=1 Tax=Shewanella psychrotolerans TaxID=2864206 RepID=UPI001C656C1A|nr:DUF1289 domain-containing protein [Shewanella psychrotolerans]QYK02937.1 DUF1289 domain-containing protein [Shewanella psychrotolerans]